VDAAQLVLVEGMIGSGKTTTALRIGNCLGGRLVFTTRRGAPVEPRNFSRSFDGRIARAEVRRITLHGTRKTCGTLLAALDVHPRVAMQILRHSQISVTMEIYTEATSEATRAALKRLGEELSPHTRRHRRRRHRDRSRRPGVGAIAAPTGCPWETLSAWELACHALPNRELTGHGRFGSCPPLTALVHRRKSGEVGEPAPQWLVLPRSD
jgi:Phage integrase family